MLQNKNVKDNVNNEPYFTHKSKIAILKNPQETPEGTDSKLAQLWFNDTNIQR